MDASNPAVTQSTIQQLIDLKLTDFKGALVERVTTAFLHQERILEDAKRDLAETRRNLEAYKEAFSIAERDRRDLEERFEQERQALKTEIRQLKERDMQGSEARFEQESKP